jgi:hypothetical protein
MGERHEMLDLLVELTFERQRIEVVCEALRDSLQRIVPPNGPVNELDGEKIANTAIALHARLKELASIRIREEVARRALLGDSIERYLEQATALMEQHGAKALRDLVLNNTRAFEHLTKAMQANFYCPAARETAAGKK